ncbi:hypothetical protein COW86_02645 [Candidatus Kuenenbacteria bacterium CG22_combo_CG10-13_8_21_14_all_39_9]|uniref:Uncharacterized protein n=1 Tax=Candidatus Kuenenbacteria bacterium CG22_combo_CG10-13_8_21_14_all_39_9 TaxID=1974621 RepID=A0A2H0D0I0_9BACT|nr:MAG: hypothetical protein COW86_02645 [Candidatus Kuenenbacteria bacterium CG22_combo_CG10-13_8_21_14_all_39_9]
MEEGGTQKLEEMNLKIDAILKSVEKTRRYFQIMMWVTIAFIVLPIVASIFVIPFFLNSYLGAFSDSGSSPSDTSIASQLELLNELLQ